MNSKILLLVGGLVLAGSAMAGEPVPQQDGASSSALKMAIDPKTRKLRPVTPAESAALDAQAKADRRNTRSSAKSSAKSSATTSAKNGRGFYLPETQAEAEAGRMERGGIDTIQPLADTMSALQIVRNADGSLSYFEDGAPVQFDQVQTSTVEAARE